jgi:hypothetical protein
LIINKQRITIDYTLNRDIPKEGRKIEIKYR